MVLEEILLVSECVPCSSMTLDHHFTAQETALCFLVVILQRHPFGTFMELVEKGMRVVGIGSVRNEMLQVQDVLYVAELNPNIKKTIISLHRAFQL